MTLNGHFSRPAETDPYGMCVGWAEKKNVCDVEKVAIYAKFIAIYAVLLQNLLFTLFCREISCGEKLSPKLYLWRKNDKYQVWIRMGRYVTDISFGGK